MRHASAIEATACVLAINHGYIPATINLRNERSSECDLDWLNSSREQPVKIAMNNAYAFGGNNSSLIFRSCEG